jgi:hypothetical protein
MDFSVFQPSERIALGGALGLSGVEARGVVRIDRADLAVALAELDSAGLDRERLVQSIARPTVSWFLGPKGQERLVEPSDAVMGLRATAAALEAQCARLEGSRRNPCRTEKGIEAMLAAATRLEKLATDVCRSAATAIKPFEYCDGQACQAPAAVAAFRNFDEACLSTMTAWRGADGRTRVDLLPPVFRPTADGAPGALPVLLLIEISDGVGWSHLCGGLLLSGGRALTARHCIYGAGPGNDRRDALKEKRLRARRVSDGATFELGWSLDANRRAVTVAQDFIELPIVHDGAPPLVPAIRFERARITSPAVALGHFVHHDQSRLDPATGEPLIVSAAHSWKVGLRWANPGACMVIQEQAGCVRTVCQTTRGYSGTPLFADRPDGALVVYGLISQAQTLNSLRCDAPEVAGREAFAGDTVSTAAAFPVGVQP